MERYKYQFLEKEFNVSPCKNYRKDTGQCKSGCKDISVRKGDICPYDIKSTYPADKPQTDCPCYKN